MRCVHYCVEFARTQALAQSAPGTHQLRFTPTHVGKMCQCIKCIQETPAALTNRLSAVHSSLRNVFASAR